MRRKICVTGVSGFAGSGIGRLLSARTDVETIGISRRPPLPGSCHRQLALDMAEQMDVQGFEADAFVHCAALSAPWGAPESFRRNNVESVRHALDLAKRGGCRHFVFISSTAVHYEFRDQLGLSEESPFPEQPINLYAASKREGEALVAARGLPFTILRPRALFGPGDTVLFPRILHAAGKGMLPRLKRPDGGQALIDLLDVGNLAEMVARILDERAEGIFVLTNGEPVRAYDLLEEVLGALGLPGPGREVPLGLAFAGARLLEWHSRFLGNWREPPVTRFGVASLAYSKTFDISHATRRLGPVPVPMAEAVSRFIDWQRKQPA